MIDYVRSVLIVLMAHGIDRNKVGVYGKNQDK